MKQISLLRIILLFSSFFLLEVHAEGEKATSMIQEIAKEFKVTDKEIVLTMKNEGQRYLFTVDKSKPRVLKYGEVVRLKPDFKNASFKSRGRNITITSIEGSPGNYTICEIVDTRSLGGKRECTTKAIKVTKDSFQELEPEDKNSSEKSR